VAAPRRQGSSALLSTVALAVLGLGLTTFMFSMVKLVLASVGPSKGATGPHAAVDVVAAAAAAGEAVAAEPVERVTPPGGFPRTEAHEYTDSELIGVLDEATRAAQFAPLPEGTTSKPGSMLRKEALQRFLEMREAAKKAGVTLTVVSALRTFDQQKGIWERKWSERTHIADPAARARDIMKVSSMPGTSRHHWGTDVDLNALTNSYFDVEPGRSAYAWLLRNAGQFGFCQVYTAGRPAGYEEERWHWSYMPIAGPMLEQYQARHATLAPPAFAGSDQREVVGAYDKYVLGIDAKCIVQAATVAGAGEHEDEEAP
jgi:LAS superfamily LD-carboxypeptidase LdcB